MFRTLCITIIYTLVLLAVMPVRPAHAWQPRLEADALLDGRGTAPVIGRNRPYVVGPGDTLIELARRAGVGYGTLVGANPTVDPWLPPPGEVIILPFAAILPHGAGPGITINLAELRLYLIWEEEGRRLVRIYPIGIGREGRHTPEGTFKVVSRAQNPSWTPPPSIRQEHPELPQVVPSGPDNPLGEFWIGISADGIGIHGTHKPYGIGRHVSSGCIRLYPEDIRDLYHRVRAGTPVRILYQPVKLGVAGDRVYLEVHPDRRGTTIDPLPELDAQALTLGLNLHFDPLVLNPVLREARGIPLPIAAAVPFEKAGPARTAPSRKTD